MIIYQCICIYIYIYTYIYPSSPSQFQVGLPGTCELSEYRGISPFVARGSLWSVWSACVTAVAFEVSRTISDVRTYEITFVIHGSIPVCVL